MRSHAATLFVILLAYVVGAAFLDPSGHLSNDVGGKTASVRAMAETGSFNPDLGYWFADVDPDGEFFPLRNSTQTNSGVWINSTSLTTLIPAVPLWSSFGPRSVLVIPMLGALAAAAAAGALARRVNPTSDGLLVTLVIGLASPMTIYALDFWEHTWGAALMVAGIVAVYDTLTRSSHELRSALLGGVAFGIAATMRQEALVYGFIGGVTIGAVLLHRRRIAEMWKRGIGYTLGFAVPFLAYGEIERVLIGSASARSDRGVSTLERTGSLLVDRAISSATWLLSPIASSEPFALIIGVLLVASAAAFARWLFFTDQSTDPGFARKAMIALWGAWLIGIPLLKPGWIPGMLIASPAAIFGAVWGISHRRGLLLALTVGPVPLVFATAFIDGASVQWGSRYLLATALALTALGIEALRQVAKPALTLVVIASLLVTLSGSVWTIRRSHWIADDGQQVVALAQEDVVVWANSLTAREMGDLLFGQRWLAVDNPARQPALAEALIASDIDTFVWIADRRFPDAEFTGFEPGPTLASFNYEAAFPNDIIRYVRSGTVDNPGALAFTDE